MTKTAAKKAGGKSGGSKRTAKKSSSRSGGKASARKATKATGKKTPRRKTTTRGGVARKTVAKKGTRTREEPYERIVATAVELAEQGGFEAVRLRDVAAQAQVALGTLYRRFRSKEDLLVAALEIEAVRLRDRIYRRPPTGGTGLDRVVQYFQAATNGLLRKPNLARAILRAVASGDPELTQKVAAFHGHVAELLIRSLRGDIGQGDDGDFEPTPEELRVGFLLQQIWFGALVGWSGGLHNQAAVVEQMRFSAELVLKGAGMTD